MLVSQTEFCRFSPARGDGALMRAYDCRKSAGRGELVEKFADGRRILLNTQHPMFIWWAKSLFNFITTLIARHGTRAPPERAWAAWTRVLG